MAKIDFKSVKDAERDILGTTKRQNSALRDVKRDIVSGVADYLVNDVIMPNSKTLLYETIRGILNGIDQTLQQAIFREVKYKNFQGAPQMHTDYISYDAMWNRNGRQTVDVNQRFAKPNLRLTIRDLTFVTRHEAERVFDQMASYLDMNRMVTVNDLCAILGIPGNYTDVNYGWYNLSGCLVEQTPRGWYLNLTSPTRVR